MSALTLDLQTRSFEECNVAGLALISSQKYLPLTLTSWDRIINAPNGRIYNVRCTTMPGTGLPRGVDGDIWVCLINRYLESRCPPDGVVHTTPYAILKALGLSPSKTYYAVLFESLMRLKRAEYRVTEGWFEQREQRFVTAVFNLVNDYMYDHGAHGADHRSVLRIELSKRVTRSIRDGFLKPLDMRLYCNLDSSGARTLYRVLDAHRVAAETRGRKGPFTLTIGLVEWARTCGYVDDRPDNLLRMLSKAHRALIKHGYLKDVTSTGIGRKTRLTYTLQDEDVTPPAIEIPEEPPCQEHLDAVLRSGVKGNGAKLVARALGSEVFAAIAYLERAQRTQIKPIRNPPGLLVDWAQTGERPWRTGGNQNPQAVQARLTASNERLQQSIQDLDQQLEQERAELIIASPADAAERLLNQFNCKQLSEYKDGPNLSQQDLLDLRGAVAAGALPVARLDEAIRQVVFGGERRAAAVTELLGHLRVARHH